MKNLRSDFPFLYRDTLDDTNIYFDNAATSQKPNQVINRISEYYKHENAPVHRGIYKRAETVTQLYEKARSNIGAFINADFNETIFTKGTTEGINFIASTWAYDNLNRGDEIILTNLEHSSNVLPWVYLAQKKGLKINYVPVTANGDLDYDKFLKLLSSKTKLVSVTHASNAIGTKVNIDFIIKQAKNFSAKVLVDAAQTIGHEKIDVKKLNVDFLVFSGHKMLGPTGIGVLYISKNVQKEVRPYQLGGGMAFAEVPQLYEAGTPPIAQATGLDAAINYLNTNLNFSSDQLQDQLQKHEASLCSNLISGLKKIKSIKVLGPLEQLFKSGHTVSFISKSMHSHDIAAYLDQFNIAVRAGNHCSQLLYQQLGLIGSVRASFYLYNTHEEVDFLLSKLTELFS